MLPLLLLRRRLRGRAAARAAKAVAAVAAEIAGVVASTAASSFRAQEGRRRRDLGPELELALRYFGGAQGDGLMLQLR